MIVLPVLPEMLCLSAAMSEQEPPPDDPTAERRRPPFTHRLAAFILLSLVPMLFGAIPFLAGVVFQAIWPLRIPAVIIGPIAVALFFALRWAAGWLPLTVGGGGPEWSTIIFSLVLFALCFSAGAARLRELLPRRYAKSKRQTAH